MADEREPIRSRAAECRERHMGKPNASGFIRLADGLCTEGGKPPDDPGPWLPRSMSEERRQDLMAPE